MIMSAAAFRRPGLQLYLSWAHLREEKDIGLIFGGRPYDSSPEYCEILVAREEQPNSRFDIERAFNDRKSRLQVIPQFLKILFVCNLLYTTMTKGCEKLYG